MSNCRHKYKVLESTKTHTRLGCSLCPWNSWRPNHAAEKMLRGPVEDKMRRSVENKAVES